MHSSCFSALLCTLALTALCASHAAAAPVDNAQESQIEAHKRMFCNFYGCGNKKRAVEEPSQGTAAALEDAYEHQIPTDLLKRDPIDLASLWNERVAKGVLRGKRIFCNFYGCGSKREDYKDLKSKPAKPSLLERRRRFFHINFERILGKLKPQQRNQDNGAASQQKMNKRMFCNFYGCGNKRSVSDDIGDVAVADGDGTMSYDDIKSSQMINRLLAETKMQNDMF